MQKINIIIAVLIVVIPIGVAVKMGVDKIIKAIHKRWIDTDLFGGVE